MITTENKKAIVADLAKNDTDSGNPAAQVGILTARIKELTEHLKINKKDHMARRGLLQMVGKRKKLLKYIADKDSQAYLTLIQKLGIRR
ncbi:MAG: 30S ribosomal protein S15 [Candidatus Saccharimonadales bacterium]